jgi:cytochrome b561
MGAPTATVPESWAALVLLLVAESLPPPPQPLSTMAQILANTFHCSFVFFMVFKFFSNLLIGLTP